MINLTKKQILEALQSVTDPSTGDDLVTSNRISGLVVKESHVGFAIEFLSDDHSQAEGLRKEAEKAVRSIAEVDSVTVVLTAHKSQGKEQKINKSKFKLANQKSTIKKQPIPGVKHVIGVTSAKGGVGKSTIAVNLAYALSRIGLKVGLLDADIYGPSVPRMTNTHQEPKVRAKKIIPIEKDDLQIMSFGLLVSDEKPAIWRGPMAVKALYQMIWSVEWDERDILVLDLPPGTGDIQLSIAQHVPLRGGVVVSTPQDIALLDARKGIEMLKKINVPIFGIVENMSYFQCPHCHERTDIFDHGGALKEAEKSDIPFLGHIPLNLNLRESGDKGKPIILSDPESEETKSFVDIASHIKEKIF